MKSLNGFLACLGQPRKRQRKALDSMALSVVGHPMGGGGIADQNTSCLLGGDALFGPANVIRDRFAGRFANGGEYA